LPASDRPAEIETIVREVGDLERLCGELEKGIAATDWENCARLLAQMRRATHALRNALQTTQGQRDEAFEEQLRARIQRIMQVRDGQIERLRAFHDGVGERLRTLSNWKVYARSVGAKDAPRRSAGLDRQT